MKLTPNIKALRELRDSTRIIELQDIDENPDLFVFFRCIELFQEYNLPVEHVGKLRIDIVANFFESKKLSNEIILSFVRYCKNTYDLILERVQDEEIAKYIFGDWLEHRSGITWYEYDFDLDEEEE